MATLARCYLLMGNWEYARMAAEFVLSIDKHFVKAIYAKAEALYNTCQFEHALVLFHRGKVIIYYSQTTALRGRIIIIIIAFYCYRSFPRI